MRTKQTQINFCRLAGMSQEKYQTVLFNEGCVFAEWFCEEYYSAKDKSSVLLSLPQYWIWWENTWNIRTQYILGLYGISETELRIEPLAQEALTEIFKETHTSTAFFGNIPNQWVLKAFNEKYNTNDNRHKENSFSKYRKKERKGIVTKDTTVKL